MADLKWRIQNGGTHYFKPTLMLYPVHEFE